MGKHFIVAAARGNTKKILTMLESGADINMMDDRGRTAVLAATFYNQVDMVKLLIQKGADINIRDYHLSNVLLYAGAEGLLDIVKLAIGAGADTALTNRFGGTALIPASERGHVEVVKELLENSDVDVNHINHLHWTALLEAIILGDGGQKYQHIVQLLVDHGADIHIGDREGVQPLKHAQRYGYREIEHILNQARR
ncbi:ankyrin repeat domain-containing protein [Lentibacillus saliphilus]|uniref:ankyrin repeat domain-containing protein n=1 Tax=Lentibacillus saliphilus TaxID=2737028 RepID=UPI001C2FE3A8|nr:ankyrin repeat domain-containing protein [Lentibacillus saliphilus]